MDDDRVIARSSTSTDSKYAFVITVSPDEEIVFLRLQEICELSGKSTELASLSLYALYEGINKKLNGRHVTPDSHILWDSSRYVRDDAKLQEVLGFEKDYVRLFRWVLYPKPQALHEHNFPPFGSILSRAAGNFPGGESKKHGQSDFPDEQGPTKKQKESPTLLVDLTADDGNDDDEGPAKEEPANVETSTSISKYSADENCHPIKSHEDDAAESDDGNDDDEEPAKEEPANVETNTSISKYSADENCHPIESYEDDAAEFDWDDGPEAMAYDQNSTFFQQSL